MSILCLLLLVRQVSAARVLCPNISAMWWPNMPYVYRLNNHTTGILPSIFNEAAKHCCKNEIRIDWSKSFPNYPAALAFIEAQAVDDAAAARNKSSVEIWLPFSLLRMPDIAQKTQIKILSTRHLIVFTSESTNGKVKSIYNGFKGIFPLIMMTLFFTILFGVFIWLAVSFLASLFFFEIVHLSKVIFTSDSKIRKIGSLCSCC